MREVYDSPRRPSAPTSTGLAYVIVRIFVFTVSGVARPLVGNVRTHKQRCNQRRDCIECERAAAPRVSICFVAFYRFACADYRLVAGEQVHASTYAVTFVVTIIFESALVMPYFEAECDTGLRE